MEGEPAGVVGEGVVNTAGVEAAGGCDCCVIDRRRRRSLYILAGAVGSGLDRPCRSHAPAYECCSDSFVPRSTKKKVPTSV